MKKKVKNRISGAERICAVWLCLLFLSLPLAVNNAYYDITGTKALTGWLLSAALILACALCLLLRKRESGLSSPLALPDWLFFLFVFCHILSTLLVHSSADLLLAPDNRFQGVLSFALYLPVFLILRRGGRLSAPVRFALLLGCVAAALIGVLEIFGADPIGLRAVTPPIERPRFLSTVGNISFFGALCVLILPIASWYALSAKDLRVIRQVPAAIAAMGIAGRVSMFIFSAVLGIGQGFQPVAGFNFGAKKYKRVREGFFFTLVFGSILLAIASVAVFMNAGECIRIFRDDPEVITIGIPALRAQCIGLFFVPFQVCNNMMFQSIGYRFNATFLSSLRNGAFFIPVLLFFAWRYGLPGIQVSQMVADVLTCLTCVPFTVSFFRKISSAEPEQE